MEKTDTTLDVVNKYTANIEYDDEGNAIITFTDAILKELKWQLGDTLVWSKLEDGSWQLKKSK